MNIYSKYYHVFDMYWNRRNTMVLSCNIRIYEEKYPIYFINSFFNFNLYDNYNSISYRDDEYNNETFRVCESIKNYFCFWNNFLFFNVIYIL